MYIVIDFYFKYTPPHIFARSQFLSFHIARSHLVIVIKLCIFNYSVTKAGQSAPPRATQNHLEIVLERHRCCVSVHLSYTFLPTLLINLNVDSRFASLCRRAHDRRSIDRVRIVDRCAFLRYENRSTIAFGRLKMLARTAFSGNALPTLPCHSIFVVF